MNATVAPPAWAEAVLRLVLSSRDRDTVSGDLLEAYRDSVRPARGPAAADRWYVAQVMGFVWRRHWLLAIALGLATVTRTGLDWVSPPADFHARATISTLVGASTFGCAGLWAAWRSRSIASAALAGLVTAVMAAAVSIVGALVLLAVWHDDRTLSAIAGSGGLAEVVTLPMVLVIPGVVLGTIGGVVGRAARVTVTVIRN
jgi:hypothetical protein